MDLNQVHDLTDTVLKEKKKITLTTVSQNLFSFLNLPFLALSSVRPLPGPLPCQGAAAVAAVVVVDPAADLVAFLGCLFGGSSLLWSHWSTMRVTECCRDNTTLSQKRLPALASEW